MPKGSIVSASSSVNGCIPICVKEENISVFHSHTSFLIFISGKKKNVTRKNKKCFFFFHRYSCWASFCKLNIKWYFLKGRSFFFLMLINL